MLFDKEKVVNAYRFTPESMRELMTVFRSRIELDSQVLRDHVTKGNYIESGEIAHKLKSIYGYLMLNKLVQVSGVIERTSKEGNKSALEKAMKAMSTLNRKLLSELAAEIRKG